MQRRDLITRVIGGMLAPWTSAFAAEDAPDRKASASGKIAWFGTWKEGLAEAKRTGRPILLVAAAPHCHNVSGLW